jgi:dTDP-4-dehydrorhamnose 3,5-epimerase
MQVERFPIEGLFSLTPARHGDSRGFFSEVYRREILAAEGIEAEFVQENHVYSAKRGVLRGLHFQIPPYAQGKLVRCARGAILDVAVDIRAGSPTFGRHTVQELSATNWKQLWIPPGFAHGYLVLEAPCEVIYKVTQYWTPHSERGVAWDDPTIAIDWGMPQTELTLAEKDRANPRLAELEPVFQYAGRSS